MKKKAIYNILLTTLTTTMLSACTSTNSSETQTEKDLQIYEVTTEQEIVEPEINMIFIESIEDLKRYFPHQITFQNVKQSLQANENLNDEYKSYTEEFIDLVSSKFPNIDLTVFHENIRFFSVNEIDKETLQNGNKSKQAFYRIKETTVYMHDEHESEEIKKYCYFHELWHMFFNLYLEKDNVIYYKNTELFVTNGTALDEGMITFLTEQIYTAPKLSAYPHQYDEIKILYEIYGEDLIHNYIQLGVLGIEDLIASDTNYTTAANFLRMTDQELEGANDDPIPIYKVLIELCKNKANYSKVVEILKNTSYHNEQKLELLDLFYHTLFSVEFTENTQVTFDGNTYYNANDLYYVEIKDNGDTYLINDLILVQYLNKGIIYNIYEEDSSYMGESDILFRYTLEEQIKLEDIPYEYDKEKDILIIDPQKIRGVSYVKSK